MQIHKPVVFVGIPELNQDGLVTVCIHEAVSDVSSFQ